jgi:hypothetical protein
MLLLMTVPLLYACSNDDPSDSTLRKETVQVELRSYSPWFQEEVIQSRTRSWVDTYGYKNFTYYYNGGIFETQSSIVGSTINLWFTKSPSTSEESIFTYNNNNSKWNSTKEMLPFNNYYIYGFIPQEVVTDSRYISPYNGDYQNGAVITLNGLSSVTPSDICVTVAAGNGDDTGPATDYNIGNFSYQATTGETNYIYLLFDHLYASLRFSFKVDATYDALRTIKLKKLQLQSASMKQKIDATITLEANSEGTSPISSVSFSDASYSAMSTSDGILFDNATNPVKLLSTTASDFIGCFAPALSSSTSPEFTLISTYDVYDKPANGDDEHLIREDCTATNIITLSDLTTPVTMTRGKMLTINLTVNPTYLYMLSEPDLDNPTITIGN